MTEVRDPNAKDGGDEPDATVVERVVDRGIDRALLRAAKPKGPVYEDTFAEEEGSDVGEQPTEIWTGGSLEQALAEEAALREAEAREGPSDEPTRALNDADLSEIAAHVRSTDVDPHAWYLGRSFGGFRIVCTLAAGGMATVFLARKEGPARVSKHAAIKVVHPHLAYEREFVHMFLDEARIAALIDHPNVCRVLDFGMAEGTYYLAMEYLLGETWNTVRNALADHPDGARMLPGVTAHVLEQACSGLHAAHEALDDSGRPLCIVHRDISPQNIFVAYDGTVRVLDFGIARAADRITSTRDGILKGRLAYMSPEQMSIAEVGPAADVWSIGVVLREALEGKRLFRRASDAETMLAVTQGPLPTWSAGAPEALRAIADRALSRDPAQRQASAQVLAQELAQYAQSSKNQVGTSELSVWMGLLFAVEMEQKRALLQLPLVDPRPDGAPPAPLSLAEAEPSEASALPNSPNTIPARRPERPARRSGRPAWLNVSALVALGSIGAIVGLILGRVVHREPTTGFGTPQGLALPTEPLPTGPVIDQLAEPGPSTTPIVSPLEPAPKDDAPTVVPLSPAQEPEPTAPPEAIPEAATRPAPRARASSPALESTVKPALQGEGTLLIAFEGGWAEVSLAGKRLGTTPGRFVVPAGKQSLSVRPFGTGKPFAKRVELAPGEVLKLFLSAPKP